MLKVTVITVCFNERRLLKETIESVCRQTYENIEYLILDGCSSDGTSDMMKEYAGYDSIHFYSEKDHGIYNAMNRGISRASGDYVFFLNAGDTFYNNQVVRDAVSYIKENTDAIYYGKICRISADGSKQIQDYSKQKGTLKEKLLEGYMPCHQTIFAPRRLLINHYFRETIKIRADYEWLVYCVSKGSTCMSIPLIVSFYDTTGISSRIKSISQQQKEEQEIINEYRQYLEQDVTALHRKERDENARRAEVKYYYLFQLMNQWMANKQRNISIGKYLWETGCRNVAIYGMGCMGLRLAEELDGTGVNIKYAVDQNMDNICTDLPIFHPDGEVENVDLMIVTAVTYFDEISKLLCEKVCFPIISLEDVIHEAGQKSINLYAVESDRGVSCLT